MPRTANRHRERIRAAWWWWTTKVPGQAFWWTLAGVGTIMVVAGVFTR